MAPTGCRTSRRCTRSARTMARVKRALTIAAVGAPLVLFAYLVYTPAANIDLTSPVEHFVITTNVAILAFFAGVLVARAAVQLKQYRTLLVALGFGSIGGIFAVHGLATPGILLRGNPDDALAVVAVSAQLSLLVPAVLFAIRYSPLVDGLERRVPPRALVAIVVGAIVLYAALVASYVLLAQTQLSMTLGQLWTLAWWEYHGLMLAAIAIALVALFIELDRRRGLERFLPPNVVERVIQGDQLRLEGERRIVSVMFTDLRGSTALADALDAETVVGIVNAYLRTMARSVVDRGGIIDKFTGDGLMAIFGAMSDTRTGARAAAGAALDMRAAIGALNAERTSGG